MIEIKGLKAKLGSFVLEIENLKIEKGEYFVVLGPSGVGKTVLIDVIGGIIVPQKGKILIDGKDVTKLPPEKRGIAIVPQDYALFPHMSAYDNIAYGLRIRGLSEDLIKDKVLGLAKIFEIERILSKKPSSLSGGERQRVALARALIVNPKAILLDEPLASLDPRLRMKARSFIKGLHKDLKFTAIHVTHNIADAAALSRRIGYMEEGKLIFIGTFEKFVRSRYAVPYINEIKEIINKIR